jgi:hypothetical protein
MCLVNEIRATPKKHISAFLSYLLLFQGILLFDPCGIVPCNCHALLKDDKHPYDKSNDKKETTTESDCACDKKASTFDNDLDETVQKPLKNIMEAMDNVRHSYKLIANKLDSFLRGPGGPILAITCIGLAFRTIYKMGAFDENEIEKPTIDGFLQLKEYDQSVFLQNMDWVDPAVHESFFASIRYDHIEKLPVSVRANIWENYFSENDRNRITVEHNIKNVPVPQRPITYGVQH